MHLRGAKVAEKTFLGVLGENSARSASDSWRNQNIIIAQSRRDVKNGSVL